MRQFRLVSHFCNYVAEVMLYRVVSWHQKPRGKKALTQRLVSRITDKNDQLSGIVRGLWVESFKGTSRCLNAQALEDVLVSIKDLQVLRLASVQLPGFVSSLWLRLGVVGTQPHTYLNPRFPASRRHGRMLGYSLRLGSGDGLKTALEMLMRGRWTSVCFPLLDCIRYPVLR